MTKFTKKDVEIINNDVVYQGHFQVETFTFRHRLFLGGWSEIMTREVFCRGHAVGVLLYDPDRDQVVLIEQFRIGALDNPESPWLYEIVAGIIEHHEPVEQVASRETQEEAGCAILDLIPMRRYFCSPGGTTETITLFCGRINSEGVGGIHGAKDENEDIRVHVISREQAMAWVEAGKVNNAAAIIALQWLQLHLQVVQARWQ